MPNGRILHAIVALGALGTLDACTTAPRPVEFTCQARYSWQNTGILVRAGDRLTISYETGLWTADIRAGLAPPAGNPHTPGLTSDVVPNANRSALIGRVGQSVFLIGNAFDGEMPEEGRLYCVINTDITKSNATPFLPTDGSVTMRALVTPAPPVCRAELGSLCL